MTPTPAGEDRREGQYLTGPPPHPQPLSGRHPHPDTYPDSAAPRRSRRSSRGARCRVCSCECTARCPGSCARWAGIETPCSEDLQDSKRQSRDRRASATALPPRHPERPGERSRGSRRRRSTAPAASAAPRFDSLCPRLRSVLPDSDSPARRLPRSRSSATEQGQSQTRSAPTAARGQKRLNPGSVAASIPSSPWRKLINRHWLSPSKQAEPLPAGRKSVTQLERTLPFPSPPQRRAAASCEKEGDPEQPAWSQSSQGGRAPCAHPQERAGLTGWGTRRKVTPHLSSPQLPALSSRGSGPLRAARTGGSGRSSLLGGLGARGIGPC